MENEPDVVNDEEDQLQDKMKDTREAISEKIELLEKKVMDTTVKAVTESVSTILDTTGAVKETVESVKESVYETVNSVKEFLDVRQHTQRHPWLMTLGAMAVGFGLERLLFPARTKAIRKALPPPSSGQPERTAAGSYRNGGHRATRERERESPSLIRNWLAALAEKFDPELQQLKHAAMGITMSTIRDVVVRSIPDTWQGQVSDTFQQFAAKMNVEMTEPDLSASPSASPPPHPSMSSGPETSTSRQASAGRPTGGFSEPWHRRAQMGES